MTQFSKNNTNRVIKMLVKQSLRSEKRRNIMIIAAVALAAFLISFVGTLAVALIQMQSNQVIDTYEAVYLNVTEDIVHELKKVSDIDRVGEYYLLGSEKSDDGFTASYVYADNDMMHIARQQMELINGKHPQRDNDILVSELWLDKYFPDADIGDSVLLNTENFSGEYIISGIMDAMTDQSTETYPFIISKSKLQSWKVYDSSGYRAYVHLKDDTNKSETEIKEYCNSIAEKYDISSVGFNNNYFRFIENKISADQVLMIGIIAGIVLIGAGIVIQSIFRISVVDKIQNYGQLRTIGATRKQINHLVSKEGLYLGGIGVVFGIIIGTVISLFVIDDGFNLWGYTGVIIITIIICSGMVVISIRKPVKIASEISPVEASRLVFEQNKNSHSKKTHTNLNPFSLAQMNFRRDYKKSTSIVASLSLGGIMLLIICSMLLVQSPIQMARQFFPVGDFKIYINSEEEYSDLLYEGNPLTEELKKEVLSIDGVTKIINSRQSAQFYFEKGSYSSRGTCDMITDINEKEIEQALSSGGMPQNKYDILVSEGYMDMGDEAKVGSSLDFSLGKNTVEVKISGLFNRTKLPISEGHGSQGFDGAMIYITEELFQELLPNIDNYDYSWSIVNDPQKEEKIKEELEEIVLMHNDIALDTVTDKEEYFESNNSIYNVLQAGAWLILIFGAINLINTTLSNSISRRYEYSILRSIGLTLKQLYKLILFENMCYIIWSVISTFVIGIPVSILVCRKASQISYGEAVAYKFPFLYAGIYIAVLFILGTILSLWTICRQNKKSILDQLRTA